MGIPQQVPTENGEIAVVGLACRFPGGASSPEKFWDLLSNRRSAFTEAPESRYNVDAFHHHARDKLNTLSARGGHFLEEDVAAFDAPFFKITAQEATAMDPTARMLLEVTYEALENAGLPIEGLVGSDTSCYVGCFTRDYHEMLMRDAEMAPMYAGTGTGFSLLSNRISWFYDFRGPSMTLDTACSSSLVGLHLACQGLRSGESKIAVVCGANLILSPDLGMWLANLQMTSTDGLSRSFAEGVTGYGRGEGIATVILKPLKDALRDGDSIRAVIRGTGVNQDGHTTGITLPNRDAQADLIRSTYKAADLDFSQTSFFEAHGTGTGVGDPLELGAVAQTIGMVRTSDDPLYVGSVKSNIGHLEGAAGLAGVIKSILMLERGQILPNIHFDKPNKRIPFDTWKIRVPTEVIPWPKDRLKRASVNSFGYGGTNAHVILDNAKEFLARRWDNNIPNSSETLPKLFVFSAPEESALRQTIEGTRSHIDEGGARDRSEGDFLDRLAFTLSNRRSRYDWKAAVKAATLTELKEALSSPTIAAKSLSTVRLAFVFTGQGAQWAQMGQDLFAYPVFQNSVQTADTYLTSQLGSPWSVITELGRPANESKINRAQISQPLCAVLQIALVELLRSWNIEPAAVVGHSSGEIAAAYCYGAFNREDAWTIAYYRGKVCSELNEDDTHGKGAMLALGVSDDTARDYARQVKAGRIVVGCINSPSSVTMSGDEAGIDELQHNLADSGVFCRKLKVEHAYHSHHMERVADAYLKRISSISPSKPTAGSKVKMISSVTGELIVHEQLGPTYWVQNFVSPVLFSDAVSTMLRAPAKRRRRLREGESAFDMFLEVGPHCALKGPLRQILQHHSISAVTYASVLNRGEDAVESAIRAAGELYTRGVPVNVATVNRLTTNHKPLADLPSYPWNHSLRYWSESRLSKNYRFRSSGRHDLLGSPAADCSKSQPRWRNILRVREQPWIRDHVVQSSILYPGSGSIVMVLEAVQQLAGANSVVDSIKLEHVRISKAVVIPSDQSRVEMVLQLRRETSQASNCDSWHFNVSSCLEDSALEQNASGQVTLRYQSSIRGGETWSTGKQLVWQKASEERKEAAEVCTRNINPADFYQATERAGLQYGPLFQGLTEITAGSGRCLAVVKVPDTKESMPTRVQSDHLIHPTTLDVIFHSMFAAMGENGLDFNDAAVPVEFDSLIFYRNIPSNPNDELRGFCHTWRERQRDVVADIYISDMNWEEPKIIVNGIRCRELPPQNSTTSQAPTKAPLGTLVWKPDLTLMDEASLRMYLAESVSSNSWEGEVAAVLDLASHKNPDLSILQIGLSGPLTTTLLSTLGDNPSTTPRFSRYIIADPDSDGVSKSTEKFNEWAKHLSFHVIDSDTGVVNVPWEEHSFNVIINTNQSPTETFIKYIHPQGSLISLKSTSRNEDDAIPTDHEEVTHLSESWSVMEPAPTEAWLLAKQQNIKAPSSQQNDQEIVILLPSEPTPEVAEIAHQLSPSVERAGHHAQIIHWSSDVSAIHGKPIISLLEIQSSFLSDISADNYATLKTVMLASSGVLWVTMGDDPVMQVATGYLRVVQNENINLDLRYLKLEQRTDRTPAEIAQRLTPLALAATTDREYIEANGSLYINRMITDDRLTQIMTDDSLSEPEHIPLGEAHMPLQLIYGESTQNKVLFVPVHRDQQGELPVSEVEVQIMAIGLGTVAGDEPSAREFSGLVTSTGEGCSRLKPGDRVWGCIAASSYQTFFRVNEAHCQLVPGRVTYEEAACWAITLGTAYAALADIAERQTVLIQSGASPVGQFAIQIAQKRESVTFVTVSTDEQRQMILEMGISKDNIFHDGDPDLASAISRRTQGQGMSFILNQSLKGSSLQSLWASIARSGALVDVNLNASKDETDLSIAPFRRGASYAVFNFHELLRKSPDQITEVLDRVSEFQSSAQRLSPMSPIVRPVSQAAEAFEPVNTPSEHGKVVIQLNQNDRIPVPPRVARPLVLDQNGTYLIAGGMKGLGGNLASLLARNGARHLAVVSRSGLSARNADAFVQELAALGAATRVFAADISDESRMQQVITQITAEMPPIRGVIQSAAVLEDSIYENMTHEQWRNAVRPKVQGSWILHRLLPSDLHFFVMLSSIAGVVGNRSQANYAAGNTYQDALAAYRRSQGLAAVSVDLGLMLGIGLIAERGGATNLKKWEAVGIEEREFHLLMMAAMTGSSGTYPIPSQVVSGLPTGGILQSEGLERPFYFDDPRFSLLRRKDLDTADAETQGAGGSELSSDLAQVQSMREAADIITSVLNQRLARELQTAVENIDANKPLHAYGVDSLMAVELRTWVSVHVQAEVSLFEVLGAGSIAILAGKIAAVSKVVPESIRGSSNV